MLRLHIKNAAANAVSLTRLDALARVARHRKVPFVAAYHRVVERLGACGPLALPSMEISVATLERQLDWIGSHFRIVSIDDLPAAMKRRTSLKPLAAITFDDGYRDVFDYGFPLLKRKGIPAGVFVVTDLVGTTQLPIHERLHAALVRAGSPEPFWATQKILAKRASSEVEQFIASIDRGAVLSDRLQPLTWEMLEEMRDAGMTIGSHSRTHAFLANETAERIDDEVGSSRATLVRRLGVNVRAFAYPGGSFNASVVDAVARAGY